MALKGLAVHAGILALSCGVAAYAWTREENSGDKHAVELWAGTLEQVERVEFVSQARTVVLLAKQDEVGRYWEGSVDSEKGAPPEHDNPHAPPNPKVEPTGERVKERFVAVTEGNEFVSTLIPLMAKRSLGALDPARFAEFGFDAAKPQVLKLKVGGVDRELFVGGFAPGGGDTYVRFGDTGQAYVLDANLTTDLNSAETRLMQRNLHVFEPSEVKRLKLTSGGASRELVAQAGKTTTWADPSDATKKDETATNWMSNFDRLRITSYKEGATPSAILRVDFYGEAAKPLGFVELASLPEEGQDKPQYFARSETSRWWGTVVNTTADQVVTDLSTLLKR